MAVRKKKSRSDAAAVGSGEAKRPTARWLLGNIFGVLRKHGNAIVMWCGIGWCVHEISVAFIAYAGRTSLATLSLSVLANLSVVWTLSVSVSGLAITLYLRERSQHRRTRDRLTDRITDLEL